MASNDMRLLPGVVHDSCVCIKPLQVHIITLGKWGMETPGLDGVKPNLGSCSIICQWLPSD